MKETRAIPIKNYFDPDIHALEMKKFFDRRPNYIGAMSMLKEEGDYRAVERLNEARILSWKNGKIALLDNICAHRQAKMVSGSGNSSNITCPYHHWSYEHGTGRCVRAPLCKEEKEGRGLTQAPLQIWKNLIFTGGRDFGQDVRNFHLLEAMQIERMVYKKTVSEKLNYNWKHYIDVFGENYHVPFIHPGFSSYLDLASMEWVEDDNYHAQIIKPKTIECLRSRQSTPIYKRWVELLLDFHGQKMPDYAGLLIMYYPNIMIECYPLYMVINTIHPTGPESCVSHCDYFHRDDIIYDRPDIVEAAEAACAETMLEDADICEQTAEGRKFLYTQGRDEQGPYQAPFEDGLAMFHRYYQRIMG